MTKELKKELEEKANELYNLHKNFHPKEMRENTLQIEILNNGIFLWYIGYRNRRFNSVYWSTDMGEIENAFDISLLRQNASAILSYEEEIKNKDFKYFTEEEIKEDLLLTQKELREMKEKYEKYFAFVDYHYRMMVESALEIKVKTREEYEKEELRRKIIDLQLMTTDEKDFTRKFENLLKSIELKVISFTRKDKITTKNSDYPYNMEKKFVNSKIKYLLNDSTIIDLEINKVYWDNMPQGFDIDKIKIYKI
jgi:hypothetical protein